MKLREGREEGERGKREQERAKLTENRGKSGRRSRRKRVMMDRESRWLSSGRGGRGQREDEKGVESEKFEQKQRSFPPLPHDESVSCTQRVMNGADRRTVRRREGLSFLRVVRAT